VEAKTYGRIWSPSRPQDSWRANLWRAIRTRAYGFFNDETLVRLASAKDHVAFEALVARHRNRLYTLALTSLGNEADAGDAVCEMVISAFKDIDLFGATCTPGTWLYLHGLRAVFRRLAPGKYAVETSRRSTDSWRSLGPRSATQALTANEEPAALQPQGLTAGEW
jgi:RNA polymerase sigma-70 factor (ECF subfamily)